MNTTDNLFLLIEQVESLIDDTHEAYIQLEPNETEMKIRLDERIKNF